MAENGYAKPVLVTSDWVAEHAGDDNVVVAEVDENPDLYEEGHIPGAVKLHWRDDLQDPVERDVVDRETFEQLLGGLGIGNDSTVVVYGDKNNWFAAYAYWYLKVYGHGDVRILDGGRQKWIDEGRELATDVPSPAREELLRPGARRVHPCVPRPGARMARRRRPWARRRPLAGRVRGRADRPARLRAGGRAARRPHPLCRLHPVGERGPGRRHLQVGRRAPGALRRQGHHLREGSDRLLPHRRAQRAHVVRPQRAARLRAGAKLRRLVDGVGKTWWTSL